MKVHRRFETEHDAYLHDLAFDYHGRRLATCSSDHLVGVFDLTPAGEWRRTASVRGHAGPVLKVAWAHPEFGQVLASCSSDRTVVVHEEMTKVGGDTLWRTVATHSDARGPVNDVQFAPRHHGLKLASCSSDGFVRVYEALDVMNLTSWNLSAAVEVEKKVCTCLSWNPTPFDAPMFAVGGQSSSGTVWEYNDKYRSWGQAAELNGHTDTVHDVSWAFNAGRSYHLVATACKDGRVRVFRLRKEEGAREFAVSMVAELPHHASEVWRVEFNVTGTVLASTGDDGSCRLWAPDMAGRWQPTLVVTAEDAGGGAAAAAAAAAAAGDAAALSESSGFGPAPGFGSAAPAEYEQQQQQQDSHEDHHHQQDHHQQDHQQYVSGGAGAGAAHASTPFGGGSSGGAWF